MSHQLGQWFACQWGLMDIEIWAEPFAGGAGCGLTLLAADEVDELWLTEAHRPLAALWRLILTDGHRFADRVADTQPTIELWRHSRHLLAADNNGQPMGDWELGFAAFIVNRCSRSGIIHPRSGVTGAADGSQIGARFNPDALAARLRLISDLSDRIRFTEGNAISHIAELDGSVGIEDELMMLVDPPYIAMGNRLYGQGMTTAEHHQLADALNQSPTRWVCTYDHHPMVPTLYPHRRIAEYGTTTLANRRRDDREYLIVSDQLAVPDTGELFPGQPLTWAA